MTFLWTKERIVRALYLYGEGYTMQAIAIDIGAPTRNCVCGKLFRLFNPAVKDVAPVPKPVKPPPAPKVKAPAPPKLAKVQKRRPMPQRPLRAIPEPLPVPVIETTADTENVTIFDLRAGMCRMPRWKHDERPSMESRFYCANATHGDWSWCETCAARVFKATGVKADAEEEAA